MRNIYTLLIQFYAIIIRFVAIFNPKAKQWIGGRKSLLKNIESIIEPGNIVWFHAASVGEFEQARPIIEAIKEEYPLKKILITFFSPSGYELRKNYELANYVFYLPIDTPKNVKQFLDIVKPEAAYFVKYEFWFNYINEIYSRMIPLYLVSGIFREEQHFFKWYGQWFRDHLPMFKHIYVQDNNSAKLLGSLKSRNFSIVGDTRFDRVYQNTKTVNKFETIEYFCKDSDILLAGSSWPKDESLIEDFLKQSSENIKLIIAPHEVTEKHIQHIQELFKDYNPLLWSKNQNINADLLKSRVLIIDSIGKLMHLYQYAEIAYVGGGFGAGIHNILEAACFGKPIIFGPKYQKFNEAVEMTRLKAAFSINNSEELNAILNNLFADKNLLEQKQNLCLDYVSDNIGATQKIVDDYCASSL